MQSAADADLVGGDGAAGAEPDPVASLAFSERWKVIGAQPAKVKEFQAATYQWKTSVPFSKLRVSEKIRVSGDAPPRSYVEEPQLEEEPLPAPPPQKPRQPRRVEAGSGLRFLKSASTGALLDGPERHGLIEPDYLELVARGLSAYQTGGPAQAREQLNSRAVTPARGLKRANFSDSVLAASEVKLSGSQRLQLQAPKPLSLFSSPTAAVAAGFGPSKTRFAQSSRELSDAPQSPQDLSSSVLAAACSPKGRAERRGQRNRFVALGDLGRWVDGAFGNLRAAWSVVDTGCSGYVGREQFVALLLARKYPTGDLGARNVFFHLDTDEDGLVHLEEAERELEDVARILEEQRARTRAKNEQQEDNSMAADVNGRRGTRGAVKFSTDAAPEKLDSFENAAVWKSHSTLEDMRKRVIERLEQEDPLVAQFIHFLFDAYPSLKVAYCEMDIHRNGSLTKSEFTESFKTMRSKNGQRPIQTHVADLFRRVESWCEEGSERGKIRVEDMLYTAEKTGDPILEFFGEFLAKETEQLGDCDEVTRRRALENVFSSNAGASFGLPEFSFALAKLRYADWYSSELFARLDQDRSGNISLEEFTGCLEPDPNRGQRAKPKVVVPLGSKARREQILGGHSKLLSNAKLGHIGRRKTVHVTLDSGLFHRPPSDGDTRPITPGVNLSGSVDKLEVVRNRFQWTGRSELALAGRHVFSTSTEQMPDLAVFSTSTNQARLHELDVAEWPRQGIAAFDDDLRPTRVSGV